MLSWSRTAHTNSFQDQDQTGQDRDQDQRDQDQDHQRRDQHLKKLVLISLETKTTSRDPHPCKVLTFYLMLQLMFC